MGSWFCDRLRLNFCVTRMIYMAGQERPCKRAVMLFIKGDLSGQFMN